MMKKIMSFVMFAVLIMNMTACGGKENAAVKAPNRTAGVNDVLEQGMAEADSVSDEKQQAEAQPEEQVADTEAQVDKTESQAGDTEARVVDTKPDDDAKNNADKDTESVDESVDAPDAIDVDLTALSSTMVYSEVYNMMVAPEEYTGKTVKMGGQFAMYHDEKTDMYYFACIISDATACCSQGIEFVLTDEYSYPDDYPEVSDEICVIGTFDTYMEGDNTYCTLRNARVAFS